MHTLYHHPLSPHSRYIRLVLAEKSVPFDRLEEPFWQRREGFIRLSPAGTVPVLVEPDGHAFSDAVAIAEYLDETVPAPALMPGTASARAETRRLVNWFTGKFADEVTTPMLYERLWKRMAGATGATPDAAVLRAAGFNARYHIAYIAWLAEQRPWLAGDHITLADLAAAAMISPLDYLGSIPWDENPEAKEWYARIKCRPSFRPLLADHVPGLPPAAHYTNLDF